MFKFGLMCALVISLMGVSVRAHKASNSNPVPSQPIISVQDQEGRGFLLFDVVTGEFKCTLCEHGLTFGGTGVVRIDGFNVSLSAVSDSFQIFASLNMWDRQGKAVIEMYQLPSGKLDGFKRFREFWTDLNVDDNNFGCAPVK